MSIKLFVDRKDTSDVNFSNLKFSSFRFDLALALEDLNTAKQLAIDANNPQKWSQLGELAASTNNLQLAKECMQKAQDYGGLLLLATSSGDCEAVSNLGDATLAEGKNNLAFLSFFLLGDLNKCWEILVSTGKSICLQIFFKVFFLIFQNLTSIFPNSSK